MARSANPYESLPARAFWKTAVGQRNCLDINELWVPKFPIDRSTNIATYGSCFAQHFGRALKNRDYRWRQTEPVPEGLSAENAEKFNFGVFTSRTANIYTVSLLNQWIDWAMGTRKPPDEVWESGGRYYDPFRPTIEPGGFATPDEVVAARELTLEAFRESLLFRREVFVFTLGLTEGWVNSDGGYEYPMCPGTIAGTFDGDRHMFRNQSFGEVFAALDRVIAKLKQANRQIKVLLTVSPVPLTATNSADHVLVATTYSKSVLRAVAGEMRNKYSSVDYFPSYEIISTSPYRGMFYETNQRSVNHHGVAHVMDTFFACMEAAYPGSTATRPKDRTAGRAAAGRNADVVCEEELLGAFSGQDPQ